MILRLSHSIDCEGDIGFHCDIIQKLPTESWYSTHGDFSLVVAVEL